MPQTGPKTPEGKAKSSRNAIKHGLTSEHMYVLDNEPPKDWHLVLQFWTDKLRPRDDAELMIGDVFALAQYCPRQVEIRRARIIETGMIDMEMDDQEEYMAKTYDEPIDQGCRAAHAFKTLADQSRGLDNIHRYDDRHAPQLVAAERGISGRPPTQRTGGAQPTTQKMQNETAGQ